MRALFLHRRFVFQRAALFLAAILLGSIVIFSQNLPLAFAISPLVSTAIFTKSPAESGAEFGYSIASGDVNADGFDDVIVGAPSADNGASGNGEVWVFLGGSGTFDTTADATLTKSTAQAAATFGWSVTSADINNDGYDDVIVGAPRVNIDAFTQSGEVWIFFGGSGTFDTTVDIILTRTSAQSNALFGWDVSSGDVNGDNNDDLIVGAMAASRGAAQNGEVWIFFGGSGTFDTTADAVLTDSPAVSGARFGTRVASGDTNNDGFDDVIVGAPRSPPSTDTGEVWVFLGGPGTFDTNFDAFLTKTPGEAGAAFGNSLASADLNGDSFDDIIVGAVAADTGASNAGEVQIFLGGPVLDATADTILTRTPAAAGQEFGRDVAAGDLNKDGYSDVIVGVSSVNTGRGEVRIFLGGPGTFDTTADAILSRAGAQASDLFGWAVGAGDVNNDGIDEVMAGVRLADNGAVDNGEAQLFVLDFVPPEITAPVDITVVQECGSSLTSVSIGTASATDLVDSSPTITNDAPAGGFPLGTTIVTWTATDFSGNSATATQKVNVEYSYSDVLQPINSDGSSVFKLKSTVPVKFKLSCASGESVTTANAYLFLTKISDGIGGSEMEADSTSSASTGNQFRYNSGSDEYTFNLGTKDLSAGTWQLRIALDDGTSRFVIISLKA